MGKGCGQVRSEEEAARFWDSSLRKPSPPPSLQPSKHVADTLLKGGSNHAQRLKSPGLHIRYKSWTFFPRQAMTPSSPWPQPTDPGMGPNSSRANKLLSREFLTQNQESRGLTPSHGGGYCRLCFQKARLQPHWNFPRSTGKGIIESQGHIGLLFYQHPCPPLVGMNSRSCRDEVLIFAIKITQDM